MVVQENEEENDEGPIFLNDADVLEEFDIDEEGTFFIFSVYIGLQREQIDKWPS